MFLVVAKDLRKICRNEIFNFWAQRIIITKEINLFCKQLKLVEETKMIKTIATIRKDKSKKKSKQ